MTEREFAIALRSEAIDLTFVPDDNISRWTARLIEQTLVCAAAAHVEYGLTAEHLDALLAILRLVPVSREFQEDSDHRPIDVGVWQPVFVEALRCCIYGDGLTTRCPAA